MFEQMQAAPADKILALIAKFRDDPRTDKIDLGPGVYKDEKGETPVMLAVREAEQRLYQTQTSKSYVGGMGDVRFNAAISDLVFGEAQDKSRIRTLQAPGGTGALRILCDTLKRAKPNAKMWFSDPTWPNHVPIATAAGFEIKSYPYFDAETGGLRFDAMMETLATLGPDDIVLLHGCCHNPTGANPTAEQWQAIADLATEKGFFPFVDFAYHGFGDGLEEDAVALRQIFSQVPEMAIASSCSKNFGIYRERTGAAIIVGESAERADVAISQVASVARGNYSMPPDHGAAVVRIILEDAQLRKTWEDELDAVRTRMLSLRTELADTLRNKSSSDTFDFVAHHRGMFSRMPVTPEQVDRLQSEFGIYMVGDGRFNVAGLRQSIIEPFADALLAVRG
ncbi:MAG: aromatic amino acid transaminase [Granulosicoccaceae bacterium]